MDRLDTLLEDSPAYGVLDAKDGVALFRRYGSTPRPPWAP